MFSLLLAAVLVASAFNNVRPGLASSESTLAEPEGWQEAGMAGPASAEHPSGAPATRQVALAAAAGLPPLPPAAPPAAVPGPAIIAIDPGHGGSDLGAMHRDGAGQLDLLEKDVDLRIALRLADLLRAEGYRVVLTRERDQEVNDPPVDRNGDGKIDDADELQARLDIINASGAWAFVSIHTNGFVDGSEAGTEIWWSPERPFVEENAFLAARTQNALLRRLAEAGYRSEDRGLKVDRDYKAKAGQSARLFVLGPADDRRPRPSQMPGLLGETLFVTNDTEARLLRQPRIVDAIAMGYRDGIAALVSRKALAMAAGAD